MRSDNYLPKFLQQKYKEREENPELRNKISEIQDYIWIIEKIWCISSLEYQNYIWVRHEDPQIVDSYNDTTMYFTEDVDAVLSVADEGRVHMSSEQYQLLKLLYIMVDEYDLRKDRPDTDAEIVEDPDWDKIREFAKEVYSKLTS